MSNNEWMLASASERVMADKSRRKLTASEPSKIQAVEGRYTLPYLENSPRADIGFDQQVVKNNLKRKIDFAARIAEKLKETRAVCETIMEAHAKACPQDSKCTCAETLHRLKEAYTRVHGILATEYNSIEALTELLNSRAA